MAFTRSLVTLYGGSDYTGMNHCIKIKIATLYGYLFHCLNLTIDLYSYQEKLSEKYY